MEIERGFYHTKKNKNPLEDMNLLSAINSCEGIAKQEGISPIQACVQAEQRCQKKIGSKILCEHNQDGTVECNGKTYTSASNVDDSGINSIKNIPNNLKNNIDPDQKIIPEG